MNVLLYKHRKELPFGTQPVPSITTFQPELQAEWKVAVGDESFGSMIAQEMYYHRKFRDTWVWPILLGLHTSTMPLVAHVSFAVAQEKIYRHRRSSLAIQITTQAPAEPFCLYGETEPAGSIWRHLDVQVASKKDKESDIFWRKLFESELRSLRDMTYVSVENMVEKSKKLHEEGDRLRLCAPNLRQAFSTVP